MVAATPALGQNSKPNFNIGVNKRPGVDRRVPARIFGFESLKKGVSTSEITEYLENHPVASLPASRPSKPNSIFGIQKPGNVRTLNSDGGSDRLLVVYDHWSDYKFVGELYARMMRDTLTGLGYGIDMVPLEQYQAGMVDSHRATFYLGVFYDTDIPTAFANDVMNAAKPVCWTGYNLWKLAWKPDYSYNPTFESKFGFRFLYIDDGYESVTYKGRTLGKFATETMRLQVRDSAKAKVLARAKGPATIPYIVNSGNLWVVNDVPTADIIYANQPRHDRSLAFFDVCHDIVGTGQQEEHLAFLRIEDVSASADPTALRNLADFLASENVPFVVSTIPLYRDPLGYWNGGVPFEQTINNATAVRDALKYMETKGGQIIMHGTTHQYNDIPNPNFGVSGDDWEYFRIVQGNNGELIPYGPVWEDSAEWVQQRTEYGLDLLAEAGFTNIKGWLTPHYLASPIDYAYFATKFEYSLCRPNLFATDAAGYLYWQMNFAPWPTIDEYGTTRLPETVNYLSDTDPTLTPTNLIRRATDMLVVRNGWAGMYYHPYLPLNLLKQAVRGVKSKGFTFVSPSKEYGPTLK
jgi:uncharacterized protein YdaL